MEWGECVASSLLHLNNSVPVEMGGSGVESVAVIPSHNSMRQSSFTSSSSPRLPPPPSPSPVLLLRLPQRSTTTAQLSKYVPYAPAQSIRHHIVFTVCLFIILYAPSHVHMFFKNNRMCTHTIVSNHYPVLIDHFFSNQIGDSHPEMVSTLQCATGSSPSRHLEHLYYTRICR
jgi:hypothetical protein